MSKKKAKNIFKFVFIMLFLGLFFVIYIKNKLKTELAEFIEFKDTITSEGFILRDEKIVEIPEKYVSKKVFFMYNNGDSVAKNSVIAKFYDSEDSIEINNKIKKLSDELDFIQKMSSQASKSSESVNELNKKINENIANLLIYDLKRDYNGLQNCKNILWYLLNKKQIILNKTNYITEKINNLKLELKKLKQNQNNSVHDLHSGCNGIFMNFVDGFEIEFSNNLNLEESYNNIALNKKIYENNVIGKIVKSNTWYIILHISDNITNKIFENSNIKLIINGYDKELLCKISKISKDIIIISCDFIDNEIIMLRKNNFKLILDEYNGIKIKTSALHKKNNDPEGPWGVFVKYGKYLKFKKINIVFSDKNFIICDYGPKYYSDENYVQIGDKIVTNGKNLYENKRC